MPVNPDPGPMERSIGETHRRPHRGAPTEVEICRLEKAAWDADVEHVVIWYREQIQQLREAVRMTERAWKLDADQKTVERRNAEVVVAFYTGQDLDVLEQQYAEEHPV